MSDTKTLIREWRSIVVAPWELRNAPNLECVISGPALEGISTGFFGQLQDRVVYVKPRVKLAGIAAREKICADLAADLGVPVPPVVLLERECPQGEESCCCASLRMHRHQMSWFQIDPVKTPYPLNVIEPFITDLPVAGAKAIVFDTWVDQIDHNPAQNSNIIGGTDDRSKAAGELVLLDYQMALGAHGGWENDQHDQMKPADLPSTLVKRRDRATVEQTLDALERLAESTIRDVVSRVPEKFLSLDEKSLIIRGLLARQLRVRNVLTLMDGGKDD